MSDLIDRQAAIIAVSDQESGMLSQWDIGRNSGLNFAIEKIKALPTIQPEKAQLFSEGTTSDLISRQAALEKVRTMQTYKLFVGDDMILVDKADVQTELMMLPSAQPEPKEGHWIPHETPDGGEQYECSRCGVLWEFTDGTPEDNEAYFCPKCGIYNGGERK